MKILGLDLGTNSVGWAMVNLDEDNFTGSLIDMGSRIIPSGGDQLSYFKQGKALNPAKGKSVSESAKRRSYRSSRRSTFRFKMRRDKLLVVLDILGWKPADLEYEIKEVNNYPKVVVLPKSKSLNVKQKNGYEFENTEIFKIYERRNRAIDGSLNCRELGSVLYQLNQRRGYQDIGLLGQDEDDVIQDKKDRELKPNQRKVFLTISGLEDDVKIIHWDKPKKKGKKGKPVFSVKAKYDDGNFFSGTTKLGYFDKRKGKRFEFIIEQDKEKNWMIVSVVKKTGWTKSREENNQSLQGKTIGSSIFEYLLRNADSGKKHWEIEFPIRKRSYDRIFYKKEFDALWEKQSLITENVSYEKVEQVAKVLSPNNEVKQKELITKGLKWIIKEYIIYYQRPLKGGQRKEARNCPFEPPIETKDKDGKSIKIPRKAAPVSHFLFQEYRIWQKINDLKIYNKENEQQYLSEDEYEKMYSLFCRKEKISQDDILRELFGRDKYKFHTNFPDEVEFKGNITLLRIKKALSSESEEKQVEILNTPHILEQFWHIIQTVKIKEARKIAFTSSSFKGVDDNGNKKTFLFGIDSDKAIDALKTLEFEKGYGSLSIKAIKKILPLMKRGNLHFNPDQIDHQTKERLNIFFRTKEIDKIGPKLFDKIYDYNNFYDIQGLRYDEAAELVFGAHTRAKQEAEYNSPNDIRLIKPTELRHPVVEEMINECLKVVRDLWSSEQHRKPDVIRIELARELKNNEKRRKDIYFRQVSEHKRNEEAVAALKSDQFNIEYPSLSEIERWKLWKDQQNELGQSQCVYTNTYISPSELFYTTGKGSDNEKKYKFQKDHIIAKGRVFDNSYMNKVLVLGEANAEKDKFTAREFIEGKSRSSKPFPNRRKWDDFVEIANSLPAPKRDRLLMKTEDIFDDFIERQKKETQYITRRIILELAKIVGSDKIETTSGGITNLLRQEWGLNDIFKRKLKDRYQAFEDKINNNDAVKDNGIEAKFIDTDENGRLKINEFTKRIDHRHHALDALAVACTTRKHIKYLNDKNKLWQKFADDERQRKQYEKYKAENLSFVEFISKMLETDKRGKPKFRKPWDEFCEDAISRLDEILISYKQKKFYHIESINEFKSIDKDGKKILKQQKTFAIKGSMHNDQPEGLRMVFTGKYLSTDKLLAELKKRKPEDWQKYLLKNFPKSIFIKLGKIFSENAYDLQKIKDAIKKQPLTDRNGKPLQDLPLTEQKIASRVQLIGLTEKDWKTIQNQQFKAELQNHFEDNDFASWEEAFDLEGAAMFNENRELNGKMRVDKLTVLQSASFSADVESANEIIERKNSFNIKAVFKKMSSSFTIMYVGEAGRKFKQIKLLDYSRSIHSDGSIKGLVEQFEGYNHYYIIDTHTLFYMPEEGEDAEITIRRNDKQKLFKNLYRLVEISNNKDVYFLPHTTTDPLSFEFRDIKKNKDAVINELGGAKQCSEYATKTKRMIKRFGIPVVIDRLGNISLAPKQTTFSTEEESNILNEPEAAYHHNSGLRWFASHEEANEATAKDKANISPQQHLVNVTERIKEMYADELKTPMDKTLKFRND